MSPEIAAATLRAFMYLIEASLCERRGIIIDMYYTFHQVLPTSKDKHPK